MGRYLVWLGLVCLTLLGSFGCNGTKDSESSTTDKSNIPESQDDLVALVDNGCFIRYESCINGQCTYGVPCSCVAGACITNPSMPSMNWGVNNVTDHSLSVISTRISFLNSTGSLLAQFNCEFDPFSIEASSSFGGPIIPECTPPEVNHLGYDYQPSEISLRGSSLKFSILYLDENGMTKATSVTKAIRIIEEH